LSGGMKQPEDSGVASGPKDDTEIVPVDLESVFEEAMTLSSDLDRAWSEALTQIDAEKANEDLAVRWSVALRALMAAISEREARYVAAGKDVRLDHWPPSADDVAALQVQPDGSEDERLQLEQAQLLAIELMVKRMGSLTAAMEGSPEAGGGLWQSGAFAAIRGLAAAAMRITRELDTVDEIVLADRESAEGEPMRRRAIEAVEAGLRAFENGDPEATLLHCLRAARARVASLPPDEEADPRPGTGDGHEDVSRTVAMFRLAERVICGEATGRAANGGVSLVLAFALLPAAAALVSNPLHEELVGLRGAWSEDGAGS
jgi:hypothetical protein